MDVFRPRVSIESMETGNIGLDLETPTHIWKFLYIAVVKCRYYGNPRPVTICFSSSTSGS